MLWKELEDRVYKIIRNSDITDREKAELILIEFNQYPGSGSGGHRRTTRGRLPRYVNNHFMLGEGVSQKTLRVGRKEGIIMSKTKRGKQDGTGPYKDSYQRKTSKVGKRVQAGKPCPKKK